MNNNLSNVQKAASIAAAATKAAVYEAWWWENMPGLIILGGLVVGGGIGVGIIIYVIYRVYLWAKEKRTTGTGEQNEEPPIITPPKLGELECEEDVDCNWPEWCNKGIGGDYKCQPVKKKGKECERDDECAELTCINNKCDGRTGTGLTEEGGSCNVSSECQRGLKCDNYICKLRVIIKPPVVNPEGSEGSGSGGGTGGVFPKIPVTGIPGTEINIPGIGPVKVIPGGNEEEGGPLGPPVCGIPGVGCVKREVLLGTALGGPIGGLATHFGPKVYEKASPYVQSQLSNLPKSGTLFQNPLTAPSKATYLSNPLSILSNPIGFITAPLVAPEDITTLSETRAARTAYKLTNSPYVFTGVQVPTSYLTNPIQNPLTGGGIIGSTGISGTISNIGSTLQQNVPGSQYGVEVAEIELRHIREQERQLQEARKGMEEQAQLLRELKIMASAELTAQQAQQIAMEVKKAEEVAAVAAKRAKDIAAGLAATAGKLKDTILSGGGLI
jgi:hypothetical protein